MHPKIKALIARLMQLVRNNKKQIYTSILVFVLVTILRKKGSYFIKLLPFNFFIEKFTQRYLKLLEKNILEESKLKSKLQILEMVPFSCYEDWSKLEIKSNLDQFFNISEIKENLKRKDLTQEEKSLLWDSFKKENFLRTVFTLIASGLEGASKELGRVLSEKWKDVGGEKKSKERIRKVSEEMGRRKEEGKRENDVGSWEGEESERRRGGGKEEEGGWGIEEKRRVEEGFLFFMKFVLDEGMQGLYYFVRNEVQEEVKNIKIAQRIKFEEFLNLLGSIEKRLLQFIEKEVKSEEGGELEARNIERGGREEDEEKKKEVKRREERGGGREEGGRSVKRRRKDGGIRKGLDWRFWEEGELELPNLTLGIMDSFMKNVQMHPILYDEEYLGCFGRNLPEKESVLAFIREEEEERKNEKDTLQRGDKEENENNGKDLERRMEKETRTHEDEERDKDKIKRREEMRKEEEEERRMEEQRKKRVGRRVNEICNEYLDWLESRNFQILLFHMVKFEFLKLKNRLLLHDLKNMKEDSRIILNYITAMFRITNEEFLGEQSVKTNENFYNNKIKMAIHSLSLPSADQSENLFNFLILEEFQTKMRIEQGWGELMKRVLLEEEKYFIRKEGGRNQAGDDIQELLKKLG